MKMALVFLGFTLTLINCTTVPVQQKVEKSNAISDYNQLVSRDTLKLNINKMVNSRLSVESPIYKNKEPEFYSPYHCHAIELSPGRYKIEFTSLGNMGGFNKSIMLPMITILDRNGNIIKSNIDLYELRSNTMTLPVHMYKEQSFIVENQQQIFILVTADMSSDEIIKANAYISTPIYADISSLSINRTAYARYRMKIYLES